MRRAFRLAGMVVACMTAACASRKDLAQPPDLRLGEDACDHCKMIISEVRYAAAYFDDAELPRRFDDLGCLAAYLAANQPPRGTIWLHAFDNDEWLPEDHATVVLSKDIHTAMGSGLVALGNPEAADRLAAAKNGELVTLRGLIASATKD